MFTRSMILLGLSLLLATSLMAAPLGTAFTYQGRLQQNGAPMNGTLDLRFSLFDAESGSAGQIGLTIELSDVTVNNGLFTVKLNDAGEFGPNAFKGEARWLNISVRPGTSIDPFTALTPRQAVTVAPYAQHAAGPWVTTGTAVVYRNGNVGIGTSTPHHRLRISGGPLWTANAWLGDLEFDNASALGWEANAAGQSGGMGHTNGGFYFFRTDSAPGTTDNPAKYDMVINDSGRVGIGTTAPADKLDVRGNIRLGPSGQFFAPSGEENLRIIRGEINEAGNVVRGLGFTAVRLSTGMYRITFNTPFADRPNVVATAHRVPFGGATSAFWCIQTAGITTTSVDFMIGNVAASAVDDQPFDFIAIGPR